MEFTNEFRVGVPPAQAWAALTSVERIAPCMPGAQLTGVEGDEYQGTIKVKVGPVTAQYRGVASFESQDAEAHRAVLQASGREARGQGNASARIIAQLVPDGDGTRVTVDTALTITGKIAQFGRGLIADVSDRLLQTFAANLEAELSAPAPDPADVSEPSTSTSTSGSASPLTSAPSAAEASTTPATGTPVSTTEELPHAPVEPVAGPATPGAEAYGPDSLAAETDGPGTTDVDTAELEAVDVEAIDLLAVARGALLKRALPVVAVAVVVVALVAWLLL